MEKNENYSVYSICGLLYIDWICIPIYEHFVLWDTYFVTLNIRNSRSALNTDRPNEPPLTADHTTSNIEPMMTTQSKRLNAESKYIRMPNAYILMNISIINSMRNTYSDTSEKNAFQN